MITALSQLTTSSAGELNTSDVLAIAVGALVGVMVFGVVFVVLSIRRRKAGVVPEARDIVTIPPYSLATPVRRSSYPPPRFESGTHATGVMTELPKPSIYSDETGPASAVTAVAASAVERMSA